MSLALEIAPRLSAEGVVKARSFRRRVEVEDASWLAFIRGALRPIDARRQRYPGRPLRPELLDILVRQWQVRAPQQFRISFNTRLDGARRIIRERRLGVGRYDDDLGEAGISVVEMIFVADRDGVRRSARILATFSLFAIASRFVRSTATDDSAVIADMAQVAAIDFDRLGPAGGGVKLPAVGWRGRLATIGDAGGGRRRIVAVHTWLPA